MVKRTNEELVVKIQNGEKQYIKTLYLNNLGLIKKIASAVTGSRRNISFERPAETQEEILYEDLIQQAFISLYKTIEGWNGEEGDSFVSYFAKVLKRDYLRYMADMNISISIPVNQRSLIWKYKKIVQDIVKETGKLPDNETVANAMGLSVKQVIQIKEDSLLLSVASTDAYIDEDETCTVLDMVSSDEDVEQCVTDRVKNDELKNVLWQSVDSLPGKYQSEILHLRFEKGSTFEEIAKELNVSSQLVHKCCQSAIRKLRKEEFSSKLKPYCDEACSVLGYANTGLGFFRRTGLSSVESAVMKLDEYKRQLYEYDRLRNECKVVPESKQ